MTNGRAKISKSDPASVATIHMIGFAGYSSAACVLFTKPNKLSSKRILKIRVDSVLIFVLLFSGLRSLSFSEIHVKNFYPGYLITVKALSCLHNGRNLSSILRHLYFAHRSKQYICFVIAD